MDELRATVTNLTGAVNSLVEQMRSADRRIAAVETGNERQRAIENRIASLERIQVAANPTQAESVPLVKPSTEADLSTISKLPDCVKELQIFDGNAADYISWVHTVEGILSDYEIVRNKPIYRAILQSIRGKIRGNANVALLSYNIYDDDWIAIKKCLSLHYADKRDIRTLEHQLSRLTQRGMRLDEFYAQVNHQFSLIINKIKSDTYTQETMNALVQTYRNRALDVFICGLDGELAKMITVQKPQTLPEAYSACLDIQNLNFRRYPIHSMTPNHITVPVNQVYRPPFRPNASAAQSVNAPFYPQSGKFRNSNPPPRPTAPKPHEKMDVDPSVQSRAVNYMNRPQNANSQNRPFLSQPQARQNFQPQAGPTFQNGYQGMKRRAQSANMPLKYQRVNHINMETTEDPSEESNYIAENYEFAEQPSDDQIEELVRSDDVTEDENFMSEGSPAFHI